MNTGSIVLAALVLAGALAIDATAERAAPPAPVVTPAAAGTSLSCPLAVDGASRSFVHVANIGRERARVKVTVIGQNAKSVALSFDLAPEAARSVPVHGRVSGRASAMVEATGGEIVASHSLWFPSRARTGLLQNLVHPTGGAGAPCRSTGSAELVIPHVSTQDGDTRLALFNPGAAEAVVDITLLAGNRVVRAVRLQGQLIAGRGLRTYDLSGFSFNTPELTVVIGHDGGRVAAEAMVIERRGVSLLSAAPPASEPLTIAAATGAGSTLGLAALGSADAGIAASVLGRQDQGRARGIPADLAPMTGSSRRTAPVDGGGPGAFQLETTVGGPLGIAHRWMAARAGRGDPAAAGHLDPARRMAAAFGVAAGSARARLIIVNPDPAETTIRVRRSGADPIERALGGGRIAVIALGSVAGALWVEVEADRPVAALVEFLSIEADAGLATAYGMAVEASPLDDPDPVALAVEPRAGVTAPLPG